MTTQVNVTRQTVLTAQREFDFQDFVSGVATPLIYLKPSTRILRGWIDITTAWNSGTSATLSIGDTEGTDDVDRWLVATNVKASALTPLTAPQTKSTIHTAEALTGTLTSVGTAPTAGKGVITIEYIEENTRSSEFMTRRA